MTQERGEDHRALGVCYTELAITLQFDEFVNLFL